jgi:GDP-4-dehydro-6-deoxy-D-mannose reductase
MGESRTMLLLGAGGFLGAHLLEAAEAAGFDVVPVGREAGKKAPACDLLDPNAVSACLEAVRPALIVNAAGAASVGRSWEHPAETFAVNATGVLNLLDAVLRRAPTAHVLCLSSADVYGAPAADALPLKEKLEPSPVTPYGASKVAMEVLCGQYVRGRGLHIGVARAFNLIGPGQSPSFAVPGFVRRVVEAERAGASEVELALGNPGAVRDFVDVREAAAALVEISARELRGTYNLCSGRGTTIAELVEALAALSPLRIEAHRDPGLARPADPPALVGDPRRLREATGFAAETPLARSLADLLESRRAGPASA